MTLSRQGKGMEAQLPRRGKSCRKPFQALRKKGATGDSHYSAIDVDSCSGNREGVFASSNIYKQGEKKGHCPRFGRGVDGVGRKGGKGHWLTLLVRAMKLATAKRFQSVLGKKRKGGREGRAFQTPERGPPTAWGQKRGSRHPAREKGWSGVESRG